MIPGCSDRFKHAAHASESRSVKRTHVLMLLALLAMSLFVASPVAHAETTASTPAAKAKAKDEPSAAERRAASSEFERGKLDQSAFDKAEAKQSGKKSSGGGGGSIMRGILGFVVVLGSIYGIHWLLKKWGQSGRLGATGSAGVIDVVATTPLAQGRALHLVRVGEELVLVGATEQSITRIGDVNATVLGQQMGNAGKGEFQAMLSGAMYGSQPGVPNGMGGSGSSSDPFLKRFLDNLRLSTAR
jgi:flagellar biosynthetic protein FliO